ncbi:MAG: glycerol-3-phosphate dehydrogenase/oxidase [Bacteroidetes bacterium]|nr:glycerol-3-phosphate dehydrogenase/oxidase [Bacteroidota bacterium]
MTRDAMLSALEGSSEPWDFIIIGGGATGLGCAVEAASRGYRTLLLEGHDFAKGTSSRSTKLVHGGVRYLQQGNVALVLEALKERGLLLQNAPHLVHDLPFVVPSYEWWEGPFYGIGLKMYDLLAGKAGFEPSERLTKEEVLEHLPTLEPDGLRGGTIYYDGQFDDARLAITLARTAADHGAVLLNYMRVVGLMKAPRGEVIGVQARDEETGAEHEILARAVINATGVFADAIRKMDDADSPDVITVSQGVHIVLPREFLPGNAAIMVPKTDDGRVLFAIPWQDRLLVGTTDTEVDEPSLEPRPLEEELDFLLRHAAKYLVKDPTPADVLSTFAGLRPLVGNPGDEDGTADISREHALLISKTGLITITGGKWTTYRKMGEETIDKAAVIAALEERPSVTEELRLHGYHAASEALGQFREYGSDAEQLVELLKEDLRYAEPLHPKLPFLTGEIVWAARHEMARTVEDVLSRRTRSLLLDARASIEAAPAAAALLAEVLEQDEAWADEQVEAYSDLAEGYLIEG